MECFSGNFGGINCSTEQCRAEEDYLYYGAEQGRRRRRRKRRGDALSTAAKKGAAQACTDWELTPSQRDGA